MYPIIQQIRDWLDLLSYPFLPLAAMGVCLPGWRERLIKFPALALTLLFGLAAGVTMALHFGAGSTRYGAIGGILMILFMPGGMMALRRVMHGFWPTRQHHIILVLLLAVLALASMLKVFHHRDNKNYLSALGCSLAADAALRPGTLTILANFSEPVRIAYYAGIDFARIRAFEGLPEGDTEMVFTEIKRIAGRARLEDGVIYLLWRTRPSGNTFDEEWQRRFRNNFFQPVASAMDKGNPVTLYAYDFKLGREFPGCAAKFAPSAQEKNLVQLLLPPLLLAREKQPTAIFLESLLLAPNAGDFIFEFRINGQKLGQLYADRWMPTGVKAGHYQLEVTIKDGADWPVAVAKTALVIQDAAATRDDEKKIGIFGDWLNRPQVLRNLPKNFSGGVAGDFYDGAILIPDLAEYWDCIDLNRLPRLNAVIARLEQKIAAIRAVNPACRIWLAPPPAGGTQDEFGRVYHSRQRWDYRLNQHALVRMMLAKSAEWDVNILPLYLELNPQTDYARQSPVLLSNEGGLAAAGCIQRYVAFEPGPKREKNREP